MTVIANRPFRLTGRIVLLGFIAFFGVIFAVNGAFVYFALNTWSGLVVDKAYQRGLDYNEVLSDARASRALGWHAEVEMVSLSAPMSVRLTDSQGKSVERMAVTLAFTRPVHEGADVTVEAREVSPGLYMAEPNLAYPGNWQLTITANGNAAGQVTYRLETALRVAP